MTALARKVLHDALLLSDIDRETVFEALAASLRPPASEVDAAWLAEADRRMQAYVQGLEPSYEADEVMGALERQR
jgi:hypothetical protein